MISKDGNSPSFVRRTLTTAGDLLLFLAGTYLLLFIYLSFLRKVSPHVFLLITIVLIISYNMLLYIGIPSFTNGKTAFSFMTRVRIVREDNNAAEWRDIARRQKPLSLTWVLCFAMFATLITPELLEKFSLARNRLDIQSFSTMDQLRVYIISSMFFFNTLLTITCFLATASRRHPPFFERISETKLILDSKI